MPAVSNPSPDTGDATCERKETAAPGISLTDFRPLDDCPLLLVREGFLNADQAQGCYRQLLAEQPWPDNSYEVFGRRFTLPRRQTWHADEGIVYSYSNNLLQTLPWTPALLSLRQLVEAATGAVFNAVLVNLYRNGEDSVGWHSDDETELGEEPVIASLSLGAARYFDYQETAGAGAGEPKQGSVLLAAGSLLLMLPPFQQRWQHSVPPCDEPEGRINLTFRYVYKRPHVTPSTGGSDN